MANKRESILLKAWARYDGNGELIPSSIIYRKKKPYGKFKEVVNPAKDLCCTNPITPVVPTDCGTSGSWYNVKSNEGEGTTGTIWSVASVTNNQCFSYSLAWDQNVIAFDTGNYPYPAALYKYDTSASIIWEQYYGIPSFYAEKNYSLIFNYVFTDSSDNVYLCYQNGIAKLDGATGNVIWEKVFGVDSNGYLTSIYNGLVAKNGYVYLVGESAYNSSEGQDYEAVMFKINPATGDVEQIKTYHLGIPAPSDDQWTCPSLSEDAEGNLFIALGYYNDLSYGDQYPGVLIKVDSGLNVVWCSIITTDRYNTNTGIGFYSDLELMSTATDKYSNVYGIGWYQGDVLKFSPDGQVLFDYVYYSIYGPSTYSGYYNYIPRFYFVTEDNGTVWAVGECRDEAYRESPQGRTSLIVFRLDSSGNIKFVRAIENNDSTFGNSANYGPQQPQSWNFQMGEAKNGILVFSASYQPYIGGALQRSYDFQITPTNEVTGNIGYLTFLDVTDKFIKIPFTYQVEQTSVVVNTKSISEVSYPIETAANNYTNGINAIS